jgi:hypothetical protein
VIASSISAPRRRWGQDLVGACHTIARPTRIALAAPGVVFAGPASAESKSARALRIPPRLPREASVLARALLVGTTRLQRRLKTQSASDTQRSAGPSSSARPAPLQRSGSLYLRRRLYCGVGFGVELANRRPRVVGRRHLLARSFPCGNWRERRLQALIDLWSLIYIVRRLAGIGP